MNSKPKKKFGQNFLKSESTLNKIISGSGVTKNDIVIEIGPGRGALTKHLVKHAKQVYAFEIDTSLTSYLNPIIAENSNLEVIYQDILETDLNTFIEEHIKDNVKVIANIPYYITSPIIFMLLDCPRVTDMTLLIQKEVADRLASLPNSKDYGAVTVLIQSLCEVTKVTQVKRTAFYPAPNVDSTVIKLTKSLRYQNVITNQVFFKQLVKAAFTQKRKTLLNNFESAFNLSKDELLTKLQSIDPKYDYFTRAEAMTIEDFIALSNGW
ncbi:16S rRNA (adenine1518-N6/adenine1519-N6)-dimethyltransferase [Acholeplasma morum]|uniref:16S rRNA (adenine(1518)-N(6)/adenine(1519)-N(6))- dimethyltransferase RsmA n=1 Tax=Paracholeplasma morum TaxID=264637 RepID=UPI00195B0DF1|nr:16S rRNA (adenine(1518)-N(6)/adenine(1519)-N(6))-dimethyltransferase RsmA [Paracholeplasma morum]MBM7453078.1 16S rRNA (adenine1518-N6/adenine1519-N6)-dimethyltransferase [Paracholeplasma morum]